MSDKEAAAWAMFKVQAQTGADGQPRKKNKRPAQGDHASQAGTTQAATTDTAATADAGHGSFISPTTLLGLSFLSIILVYWLFKRLTGKSKSKPRKSADGFEEAEYGIPHCNYKETADGFIVTFRQLPARFHVTTRDLMRSKQESMIIWNVLQNLTIGVILSIKLGFSPTTITVSKDAVFIDKKKLRRRDFGSFAPYENIEIAGRRERLIVLGYQYGNKNFKFGGAWDESDGMAVASALNQHLRRAPKAGDEKNPSPDALRRAGPANEFD